MHASLEPATDANNMNKFTPFQWLCALAIAWLCCLPTALVHAAPDEIVVFTDEFEKKDEVGYELHFNYAARARKTPDYPGEQPPHRIFRVMPEVVWGIAEKWNLGVHVPFSYNVNTRTFTLDGLKVRLHYLNQIEQSPDSALFYGANYEIAIYDKRITESRYTGEIRGILGMRRGDWRFTVNPIVNQALRTNPGGRAVELDVFGQAMRSFGEDFAVGVEHYAALGRLSKLSFGSQSEQISYLVTDFKTKKHFDIHLGVGHGWNKSSDKLVFKALIGLPF
jgi:hypothetical protein